MAAPDTANCFAGAPSLASGCSAEHIVAPLPMLLPKRSERWLRLACSSRAAARQSGSTSSGCNACSPEVLFCFYIDVQAFIRRGARRPLKRIVVVFGRCKLLCNRLCQELQQKKLLTHQRHRICLRNPHTRVKSIVSADINLLCSRLPDNTSSLCITSDIKYG